MASPLPINPSSQASWSTGTCWLTNIPLEVLVRITKFVATTDFGNVRLTCRVLEQALFHFFSHEFFRKKQFMVSTFSLRTLIDISKHPTLSPFLTHVIIATDRLSNYMPVGLPEAKEKARHHHDADYTFLVESGLLRDMLAEALGNLRNLETIDIRDFNSRSRNRDGLNTEWRSYGSRTLQVATNSRVETMYDYDHTTSFASGQPQGNPSTIFRAIISALAAGTASPKGIEINLRSNGWFISDSAYLIHPRIESSLAPILRNLKTLHLAINTQDTQNLRRFLSTTPNVTWLRINGPPVTFGNFPPHQPFFDWLGRSSTSPTTVLLPLLDPYDTHPLQFQFVERLDLGNLTIVPEQLLKIAAKFAPSLRSLSLRRVRLVDVTTDIDQHVNPWVSFFSGVARLPGINLRSFELGLLSQQTYDHSPSDVFFGADPGAGLRGSAAAVYKGDSTSALIQKINQAMKTSFVSLRSLRNHFGVAMDEDSDEDDEPEDDEDDEEMDYDDEEMDDDEADEDDAEEHDEEE